MNKANQPQLTAADWLGQHRPTPDKFNSREDYELAMGEWYLHQAQHNSRFPASEKLAQVQAGWAGFYLKDSSSVN